MNPMDLAAGGDISPDFSATSGAAGGNASSATSTGQKTFNFGNAGNPNVVNSFSNPMLLILLAGLVCLGFMR